VTNPIFFAEPQALARLSPGAEFTLTGPEARHAATVKRLAPGEAVDIVDGNGRRITGEVTEAAPSSLTIRIGAVTDDDVPRHELILVQALAKGDRDEMAIESATELGVDAVVPWQAERSIVRWRADKAAKGLQKWTNTVTAASKQARRSRIPRVEPLVDGKELGRLIAGADLALVLHEDAADRLVDVVASRAASLGAGAQRARILMIVGPEGGIGPRELEAFESAGACTVRLGPHVLRSSTAGPTALALLSHLLDRW
jgi:16S rRNA (uracil1498-N3)-methyltransferase